jgi:hypothetical protein
LESQGAHVTTGALRGRGPPAARDPYPRRADQRYRMPGMDGYQFMRRMRAAEPKGQAHARSCAYRLRTTR